MHLRRQRSVELCAPALAPARWATPSITTALYDKLEPDVYALLVRDDGGASFLTAIDTVSHPDVFAWLTQNCPQRTLDNLTNNFVEPRQPLFDDEHSYTKSRATVAANMMEFVQKFQPKRAVISGQGWCFKPPVRASLCQILPYRL